MTECSKIPTIPAEIRTTPYAIGSLLRHVQSVLTAVKLEDARRVISAAETKASEIGQPMNIAVADEGGNIVAPRSNSAGQS